MRKPLDRRTRYARYLNAYDAHGMTAMHVAKVRGDWASVTKLLEAGALRPLYLNEGQSHEG